MVEKIQRTIFPERNESSRGSSTVGGGVVGASGTSIVNGRYSLLDLSRVLMGGA